MNRNSILSFIIVAGGTGALLATTATSQFGAPKAFVNLQPTTPGTSQSGHANVSGTIRASQLVGGGAGLTNVNAATLGGLPSSAFLQSVPVPLLITGATNGQLLRADNGAVGNGATAVYGITSGPSGVTWGVRGDTNSSSGSGVYAVATASSGLTYGGHFESSSSTGYGVYGSGGQVGAFGETTNTSGNAFGGFFQTASTGGTGVFGRASALSGPTSGGLFESFSPTGNGVYGIASSSSGATAGVFGQSQSPDGYGVRGLNTATSGVSYGGHFVSSISTGYGVFGSGGYIGVSGESTSTVGSGSGGYFQSSSTSGNGVYGRATASTGISVGGRFESFSQTGTGVVGIAHNINGGQTNGGYFLTRSANGIGVVGVKDHVSGLSPAVYGFSQSNVGPAVLGEAVSTDGTNYGGIFRSLSPSGKGVFGDATATTGVAIGRFFHSASNQGYAGYFTGVGPDALYVQNTGGGRGILVNTNSDTAVWANAANAFASVDSRNAGPSGWGVYGLASHSSGGNAGVVGQTSSPAGWGVYSFGNLGATGVKSFRIDHPFDPENKYLLHYSSESPMPQNFYLGNVVTDNKGYAWVELPDYFGEINTNFKYQLTVIDESDSDTFIWAKVVKKINGNQFRIRTNMPGIEVSWRVDADRNDLYVRNKRPMDVAEKQGPERGKYQHPELYGMPKERGMNYRPEMADRAEPSKPKR